MKAFLRTAGLVAALTFSSLTHASEIYNFVHSFASGTVVSGSFSGDANGDLITNLSNISASINGTAMNGSGSLHSASYNFNGTWSSGTAVASFSGTQNNLMFIDSNFPSADNYTNYFQSISAFDFAYFYDGATNVAGADDLANDHWSVSPAASAAVPEPATPLILLSGLVLLGCTLRTRKRS